MSWREQLADEFNLSTKQVDDLENLLELLLSRSDRSLTAVTGRSNIINVHFRDSLSLLGFPEVDSAESAVDVGSGAGFPGLPLAIAKPALRVTLLESRTNKCRFIAEAIGTLGLKNAEVVEARSEAAGRSPLRDSFDIALARALGPLPTALEYSLPLVKKRGYLLLQRGARKPGDDSLAAAVAAQLQGKLNRIVRVEPWPGAGNLHVWVFKKGGATPVRFPRKPGMAKKRPLTGY